MVAIKAREQRFSIEGVPPVAEAALAPASPITERAAAPIDRELWASLATIAKSTPATATSAIPVRDSRMAPKLRLDLIASAEKAIVASTYGITPDDGGIAFVEALIAARRNGRTVVLTIDSMANAFGSVVGTRVKDLAYRLRELRFYGGHVVFYGGAREQAHTLGAGTHLKMLAIDGERLLIGGRNIGTNFEDWPDYDVLFAGEIAPRVLLDAVPFLGRGDAVWDRALLDRVRCQREYDAAIADLRKLAAIKLSRARREGAGGPRYLPVIGDPLTQHERAGTATTRALVKTIDSTKRSLVMSSNYARPFPAIRDALLRARARDVDVTVITTGATGATVSPVPYVDSIDDYRWMRAHGITVIETNHIEHGKLYLFDDNLLAFGSYNVEAHSDERLVESLIFTNDRKLIDAAEGALLDTATNRQESRDEHDKAAGYGFFERVWLEVQALLGGPFI